MKATILFVDDELPILKSIGRLFRDSPYTVHTSPDPKQALRDLDVMVPDVIVTDYRMPGMDGVTFLQLAAERCPDMMGILLTGYADVRTAQEAINQAHVYRFLTKPWKELELHNAIQSALFQLETQRRLAATVEAERESNHLLKTSNEKLQRRLSETEGVVDDRGRLLRVQFAATARSLLSALALRHPPARLDGERVAYTTVRILELAGEAWLHDSAVMAGWLHHIGHLSVAVPYSARRMDPNQSAQLSQIGAEILQNAGFPSVVTEAIRNYPEHWDATGPRKLRGTAIPLLARALHIAVYLNNSLAGYQDSDSLPDEALISTIDAALGRRMDPRLGGLIVNEIKRKGARTFFPKRPPQLPEFEDLNLIGL